MYADVESRGGILEPPGICEVKFRAADQISKMHEVRCEVTQGGAVENRIPSLLGAAFQSVTCERMKQLTTRTGTI